MTWGDLGAACGVTLSTVANWRTGRSAPSVANALDIGEAVGVSDTRRLMSRPGGAR